MSSSNVKTLKKLCMFIGKYMSLSVLYNKTKQYFVICISFLFSVCVLIAYTYTSDLVYIQLYYHLLYLIHHVKRGLRE